MINNLEIDRLAEEAVHSLPAGMRFLVRRDERWRIELDLDAGGRMDESALYQIAKKSFRAAGLDEERVFTAVGVFRERFVRPHRGPIALREREEEV